MLKPVERQSLSDQVFAQLRDDILNNEYQPGDRLPSERELCDILRINRSSVREALKRLEQANLIEIRQGRGSVVLDFRCSAGFDLFSHLVMQPDQINFVTIRSILEARAIFCSESARFAAKRIQKEELARLLSIVETIEACDKTDTKRFQYLDWEFQYALARASENLAFLLIFNSVRDIYFKLQEFFTDMFTQAMASPGAYRRIYDALKKGNAADAKKCTLKLIESGNKQFLKQYEALGFKG